jgi:hypothetical protein
VESTADAITAASPALVNPPQAVVDATAPVAGGDAANAALTSSAPPAALPEAAHAADTGTAAVAHVPEALAGTGSLPSAVDATAHQLGSAPPLFESAAHTGAAIGTTIQPTPDAGISAVGSGGPHIDVPPLDPMLLRYVGLAGFIALTLQAAARWTSAASSCGVPTRLALRNFRLLPCLAVSSGERMAHAALAVASGKPSGLAGTSATRTGPGKPAANPPTRPSVAGAAASRSAAGHMVEILVLAVLVAFNVVLISVRDVFRRENRG